MIYNYILSNSSFLTFKDNTFIVKIEEQVFFQYTVNFEFQLQFETENTTHVVYNLEDRPLSTNIGLVPVSPNSTYCCVAHKFLVKNSKPIIYIANRCYMQTVFFHVLKDSDQNCSQKKFYYNYVKTCHIIINLPG